MFWWELEAEMKMWEDIQLELAMENYELEKQGYGKKIETRKGNGITLLINENSGYGLTNFIPINEEHYRYKKYQRYKELFEKYEDYCFISERTGNMLTREETEAYIRCLGCKAERMNNFKRYCSMCPYFIDFYKKI